MTGVQTCAFRSLTEDVITKTEEMIKERQEEIEKFLMNEKDIYLAAMGAMAD